MVAKLGFSLPIGPFHPALKEPIALKFEIEGERIVKVEPSLGHCHRGIEKLAENRTWFQFLFISEHVCGICSGAHQGCYAQLAERIYQIEPTPRGDFLRTWIWEWERIHSHLLWVGVLAHEMALDTLFMYTWRDRELVMDVFEKVSGRRVVYSFNTIGGVRRDVSEDVLKEIKKICDYLIERAKYYEKLISTDRTILARTRNVGYLSKNDAINLCAVGPTTRASGVKRDVRYEEPYSVYPESPFEIVVTEEGDAWAKTLVRIREIIVSAEICKWVCDNLPTGPIKKNIPPMKAPPPGEAISRVEAPRGELFYYGKSNGTPRPERLKIRTPTIANIPAVCKMLEGGYIADIPIAFASIDPCLACMDRVVFLDTKRDREFVMSWSELRRYARLWYKKHMNDPEIKSRWKI